MGGFSLQAAGFVIGYAEKGLNGALRTVNNVPSAIRVNSCFISIPVGGSYSST